MRATINKRLMLLAVLVACGILLGAGFSPPAVRAEIEVFKIGAGADPDALDPVQQTTGHIINMLMNCWETPIFTKPDGSLQMVLADKIETVENGAAVNVTFKKGIKFHDGTPLNAAAVKWNWDRLLDPNVKVGFRAFVKEIKSIEVLDDYTVQVRMNYPSPVFKKKLSLWLFAPVSPTASKKQDPNQHPVGTGPYKFVELVPGERLVFERNENYWGKKPEIKKLIFNIIRENTTREAMLLSGDLDLAYKPSASSVEALEQNPDITVAKQPTWREVYIGMNNQKKPFTDVRVRQAFNYAVDKEAIISKVLFNLGKRQRGQAPPTMFGYADGDVQYDYNPDKAKQLLKEANFDFSQTINMATCQGRLLMDKQVSETVQAYLQAIGVKVQLTTFDWPTYIARAKKPLNETEHQISMLGWGGVYNDADYYLTNIHGKANHPPNGFAISFYSNDKFEQLVAQGAKEMDEKKREALLQEAGKLVYNEAPWIYLFYDNLVVAYSSKYKGVVLSPNEMFFTHDVTLK
jgi:peptide/nickel transport system substrate-binding protein